MRNDFSVQLHEVVSSNREIKEAVGAFSERLTEAETRISTTGPDHFANNPSQCYAKVQKLTSQMEELENRQRRSNLRVVGLPEGWENGDARTFWMTWLPKTLDIETGQPLNIEQAYRLGKMPQQTQDQTRPRTLLVKFLTYRDRDRIMKAARLKDVFSWPLHWSPKTTETFWQGETKSAPNA